MRLICNQPQKLHIWLCAKLVQIVCSMMYKRTLSCEDGKGWKYIHVKTAATFLIICFCMYMTSHLITHNYSSTLQINAPIKIHSKPRIILKEIQKTMSWGQAYMVFPVVPSWPKAGLKPSRKEFYNNRLRKRWGLNIKNLAKLKTLF